MSDDQVTTESGIPVPPFCEGPGSDAVGAPGQYPYTRGVRADGYRTRPWTMRQYAGFASAEDATRGYDRTMNGAAGGSGFLSCHTSSIILSAAFSAAAAGK